MYSVDNIYTHHADITLPPPSPESKLRSLRIRKPHHINVNISSSRQPRSRAFYGRVYKDNHSSMKYNTDIRKNTVNKRMVRQKKFRIFHRLVLVMGKIVVIKRIQGHVRSFQSGKTGKCIRRFGVQAERKPRSVYGRHGKKTRNRERKIFFIGSRLYMALSSPAARPEGTCSPKPHIFSKRNPPHIRTPCPPVSVQTCFSPCVFSVQKRDSF